MTLKSVPNSTGRGGLRKRAGKGGGDPILATTSWVSGLNSTLRPIAGRAEIRSERDQAGRRPSRETIETTAGAFASGYAQRLPKISRDKRQAALRKLKDSV